MTLTIAFSVSATNAADLKVMGSQPTVRGSVDAGTETAKASYRSNIYIVELADAAVATYMGGKPGLAATSNLATGARKLDTNSPASKKYAKYLRKNQAEFVANSEVNLGHSLNIKYWYQHAFNGIAVELSAAEAKTLKRMPAVKNVSRERFEVPLTDVGPQWISAPSIWTDPSNMPNSQGEGIVIAILDTGINHDHPSYADIGGDGFDHTNPLGSDNFIPGSYCDTTDPSFCNDKLIGAWTFVLDDPNFPVPEDSDGHGSHTSSTAGGNTTPAATLVGPTTQVTRDISGVAPHANLIMYDVCIDTCPGSALLAAINQVVIDAAALPNGIHALNYSISGGGNPYSDAVEIGFLNATAAGVYVAASAGNSGPGAATVAHLGPWVSTTAAMTHNRVVENSVVDMISDGDPLGNITGAGFTSGFGPATIINSADLEDDFPGSTLCGLGSLGDFNPPWDPGTFNGEIVACTRGTFGRVEKGANVLAAGAGGYILMDNGGGIVADAHVLPGVHITQADGGVLAAWLAANSNTTGSISGFSLDLDDANGDIMAGFSSRGPSTAVDVIKPDIGAPGVSVFAADADGAAPPEYQFLSGTSMSSPHNAGSGALLSAVQPDWTPYQIKSALMMTAERDSTLKEDGSTPTDHFDLGAGRIDLSRAQESGLVLDETPANFLAADPATGGDPKTLNLASMQDGTCVGTCSWTRTVENVTGGHARWEVSTTGPAGLELSTDPGRNRLKLGPGESKTITVTADTTLAPQGWNFATLELERQGNGPDLHMPIAVFATNSSNTNLFSKTVDAATAAKGEPLNYQISITNGTLAGRIKLTDVLPDGLKFVKGSATTVITDGTTRQRFRHRGGTLSWRGTLVEGGFGLGESISPTGGGYLPLAIFGVPPFQLPGNCDDGGFIIGGVDFTYKGEAHTQVIWSVNGTVEAGIASLQATSFANQNLPDPTVPNNLMAPFWTDLNLCAGGNWFLAGLSDGVNTFTVFEWADVPRFGSAETASFQIWIQDGSDQIWFTYGDVQGVNGTVGIENSDGTIGESRYFNGNGLHPAFGPDLQIEDRVGGTATFTFQAVIDDCKEGEAIVNRANVSTRDTSDTAIAVTECVND